MRHHVGRSVDELVGSFLNVHIKVHLFPNVEGVCKSHVGDESFKHARFVSIVVLVRSGDGIKHAKGSDKLPLSTRTYKPFLFETTGLCTEQG